VCICLSKAAHIKSASLWDQPQTQHSGWGYTLRGTVAPTEKRSEPGDLLHWARKWIGCRRI
jgi:hypothetical protein